MKSESKSGQRFNTEQLTVLEEMNNASRTYTQNTDSNSNSYTKTSKLTEDIFTTQRKKISQIKMEQSHSNRHITENELYQNHEKSIEFITSNKGEPSQWEYSTFTTDLSSNQEIPIINSKKWSMSEIFSTPIEIRNLIFRSEECIDYGLANGEVNGNLTLQGESTFWLILHCDNNIYEDTSALLQISKKEDSQKLFASLGVFLSEDEYKVFSRQQLVNYNSNTNNNKIYIENDTCNIKFTILDPGDDNMIIKIYVNGCFFENTIDADFFLPVNDKKKIFIAGSGHSCYINYLSSISYVKPRYAKEFNILSHKNPYMNNQKSCDCCIAF